MQVDTLFFWSILLILICGILLARVIFEIDFPVFKILTGSVLVLCCIMVIFGNSGIWPLKSGENEFFFKSAIVEGSEDLSSEYQLVFSGTAFDLTGFKLTGSKKNIKINNLFSNSTVFIDPDLPVNILVDAVFAGVKMPGKNIPLLGKGGYTSDSFDPESPYLNITVNVVFGNIVFMHKH